MEAPEPLPAPKPMRHRPRKLGEPRALCAVVSAPSLPESPTKSRLFRRAQKPDIAEHERGFEPLLPRHTTNDKLASPSSNERHNHCFVDDFLLFADEEEDDVMSSDPHPSQEVSVLSWTLSADTAARELEDDEVENTRPQMRLEQQSSSPIAGGLSPPSLNPWLPSGADNGEEEEEEFVPNELSTYRYEESLPTLHPLRKSSLRSDVSTERPRSAESQPRVVMKPSTTDWGAADPWGTRLSTPRRSEPPPLKWPSTDQTSADTFAWLQLCLNYREDAVADEAGGARTLPSDRRSPKDRELEQGSVDTVSTHVDAGEEFPKGDTWLGSTTRSVDSAPPLQLMAVHLDPEKKQSPSVDPPSWDKRFSFTLFSKPTPSRPRSRAPSVSARLPRLNTNDSTSRPASDEPPCSSYRSVTSNGGRKNTRRRNSAGITFSEVVAIDPSERPPTAVPQPPPFRSTKQLLFELLKRLSEEPTTSHEAEDGDESEDCYRHCCHHSNSSSRSLIKDSESYSCECRRGGALISEQEFEAILRGVFNEADHQISQAVEERNIVLRDAEQERQRLVRTNQRLESALQERAIEHTRDAAEFAEEKRRLRVKCDELEETLGKWERSFDRLKSHASDRESQLQSEVTKLRESLNARERELQTLNTDSLSRSHELINAQRMVAELQRENTQLEDSAKKVQRKHQDELNVLDQHWTQIVSNLNQLLADSRSQVDTLTAELSALKQEYNGFKQATDGKDKDMAKKIETLEKEIVAKNDELTKLKADCEELASSLHKTKKSYDQLRKRHVPQEDFESMRERNEETSELLGELKSILTATQDEKEDLRGQIHRVQSRCLSLEKALTEKEVALTIKNKMMEEQSLYVAKLRDRYQQLERETQDLKAQIKKKDQEMQKALEDQRNNFTGPFESTRKLFELQTQNEDLRQDLQEKIACLDLVAREIDELRRQRNLERSRDKEEAQKKVEALQQELNTTQEVEEHREEGFDEFVS